MQVVIIGEYNLEDSLAERLNNYGTTDPRECAAVDMGNDPQDFLILADIKITTFHIEPVDDGEAGYREPCGDSPDSSPLGEAGVPGEGDPGLAADASADYAGVPYKFAGLSPQMVSMDCVNFHEVPEGSTIEEVLAGLREMASQAVSTKFSQNPH